MLGSREVDTFLLVAESAFYISIILDKEKVDKTFGFSFLSLMRPDGTTVADKSHDLCVYKVGLVSLCLFECLIT